MHPTAYGADESPRACGRLGAGSCRFAPSRARRLQGMRAAFTRTVARAHKKKKKAKMDARRHFDDFLEPPPDDFPVLGLYAGFWGLYESALLGWLFVMPLRARLRAINPGRCAAVPPARGITCGPGRP